MPNYAKVKYANSCITATNVNWNTISCFNPAPTQKTIKLGFAADIQGAGAAALRIDRKGDLVVHTDGCDLTFHKPIVYQPANDQKRGNREVLEANYVIRADKQVSFEIASYDSTRTLIIDPTLAYSTYLGGGNDDVGQDRWEEVLSRQQRKALRDISACRTAALGHTLGAM